MALKLLFVDPNEKWLEEAKKFFAENMYDVAGAVNGKDAQRAMYNEKYFAVILNMETENHSYAEVLKFIKTSSTNTKVLIVANSSTVLEKSDLNEEKLIKLGALELITKPFTLADLKDRIEGHQSLTDLVASITKKNTLSEEVEVDLPDDKFSSIKIEEFYAAQAMLFNVYIKIGSGKYLKILNQGDTFSKERIDKYKNEKKVEFLYFLSSDRRKFIQYNNFLANKVIGNPAAPVAAKVTMIKNVTQKYIEEAYTVGVKPQVIDQGKEVCETVFELIANQEDLYTILKSYQELNPNAYTHAFLVTLYSSAIVKQFEWQSKSTIETTALACMLHDIGKTLLPKTFINLSVRHMNPEQVDLYQQHPELGLKLIENNRMINHSVKQVIAQHHEAYDGSGFPAGRSGENVLTLANIVCLADDFVNIMMDYQLPPIDALKKILVNKDFLKKYNPSIIDKFVKIFVDPSKLQKENILPVNSKIVKK